MEIKDAINHPNATIIDVRSTDEFESGNVAGSKNIPLHLVPHHIEDFKNMSKPVVLCCLSGGRSGQAVAFLKQQGLEEMYNGGGWAQVNQLKNGN